VTAVYASGRVASEQPLGLRERASLLALLAHVRGDLFVASPEQLSRMACGLGYAGAAVPEAWARDFSKVGGAGRGAAAPPSRGFAGVRDGVWYLRCPKKRGPGTSARWVCLAH